MNEAQTKLRRFSGEKGIITINFTDDDDWMVDGPPGEVNIAVSSSAGGIYSVQQAVEWLKDSYSDEYEDFEIVYKKTPKKVNQC